MMKDLFVVKFVAPYAVSKYDDSPLLTGDLKMYSKINSKITFLRVLDYNKKIVDFSKQFYNNHGNTNPKGIKSFSRYVTGIKDGDGKKVIDSELLKSGGVFEIEYTLDDGNRIIIHGEPKYIGSLPISSLKKTKPTSNPLF